MPPNVLRGAMLFSPLARVSRTDASAYFLLRKYVFGWPFSPMLPCAEFSRLSGAPSTGRSRSLVLLISRRVFPHGCDASPRERIRRPELTGPFPRERLRVRVRLSPVPAYAFLLYARRLATPIPNSARPTEWFLTIFFPRSYLAKSGTEFAKKNSYRRRDASDRTSRRR